MIFGLDGMSGSLQREREKCDYYLMGLSSAIKGWADLLKNNGIVQQVSALNTTEHNGKAE